jgi:quaternary ammonium compound-resistance protein SugE
MKGAVMNWILLVVAGLFEIAWAIGLKYTQGFTKLTPSILTAGAILMSLTLLGIAMKSLPVSVAYAVWVGIGVIGTAVFGMVILGEAVSAARLISILLILLGVIGLKLTTSV